MSVAPFRCLLGFHRWEFVSTIDMRPPKSVLTRARCRRSTCPLCEWKVVDRTVVRDPYQKERHPYQKERHPYQKERHLRVVE